MKEIQKVQFLLLIVLLVIKTCNGNLPPVFTQDMNNLALSESTQLGSIVYKLEGFDPEGGEISFGLVGSVNFEVNPQTGDVKIVKELDREKQDTLSFLVSIKDKISELDSVNDNLVEVPISVIVLDENDNAPIFQNVPYETFVREDAAIGTTVFDKVLITDHDTVGENLDVVCVPQNENDDTCDKFKIDIVQSHQDRLMAAIVLNSKLDYNNQKMIYQITLMAMDGLHNTSATMEIHVVDVQNSPPVFQGSLASIINEDSPIGSLVMTIQARDGDKGQPRRIVYDLISNPMEYFLIEPKSGELRTAATLDKEALEDISGLITLIVRAREVVDGMPSNDENAMSTAIVSITIKDVNDVAPTFNQKEYFITLPENTAIGTPLSIDMQVRDPDVGQNSVFSLRLDDVSDVFEIEPKLVTGFSQVSIRVANGSLDYENPNHRKFIVLVIAEETLTNPKLSSTATVTISVKDINDNKPKYEQESFTAVVSELAIPGQLVTTITATDMDSGSFGDKGIRYMLNGTGSEHFHLDPITGTITVAECTAQQSQQRTKRQLYDEIEYDNHIKRVNITNPGEFGIVNIDLDHTTESSDYVTYQVEEDNETIEKTNRGVPGKYPCLDYETQSDYYLNFKATDDEGRGQTSITSLRISLTDGNDSVPKCESAVYRASLDEGAASFDPPLFIKARDADILSEISYQIIGSDFIMKNFEIDRRTGQLSIVKGSSLDVNHLNEENINFNVEASDGFFSTLCNVNITIRDVNNHAPMFERVHFVTSIAENLPIGTSVETLNAIDLDSGVNAEIVYRIQHGSFNDFHIDNRTGVITIAKTLDYDTRSMYLMEIVARDMGVPSLSGTASITVNIINSNNRSPYFTPTTQRAEISEDVEVGTIVYTLIATDPDITEIDGLEYTLDELHTTTVSQDGTEVQNNESFGKYFTVNKMGQVMVAQKLRRDLFAVIRLSVVVTDSTVAPIIQQGKGLLIITIIDVNEMPPVFRLPWTVEQPMYVFELLEQQPINTTLTTLHATDDTGIESYSIINGNTFFNINAVSGQIRINSVIDYEKVKQITFNVSVTDTGEPQLTAIAQIIVDVININDNIAIFNQTEYEFSVVENAIRGTSIGSVYAKDADDGNFGRLKYSVIGEQSGNFDIDEDTGEILVVNATALDREVLSEIVLTVIATDQGLPEDGRRSAITNIIIKIKDLNDNAPVFRQKNYHVSVAENVVLHPPATILQVSADDLDQDDAGNVKFFILSGNNENTFKMDANSGILYPAVSLVGKMGQYILKVEARDGLGSGPHTDVCEIVIDVIKINQYRPTFIIPALSNATVEIQENLAMKDYLVLTVKANDSDSGVNGIISYHLQVNNENAQESDSFVINELTGELRLKKSLDRKRQSRYEIILVARDHGTPTSFEQIRFLTVTIVGITKSNPEFPDASNPYKFSIAENSEKDIRIGKIQALLHDSGRRDNVATNVYYYILLGNEDGAFYIDKTSGDIFSNKSLDRESIDMYALYIMASKQSDLHVAETESTQLSTQNLERNSTIAKVWITVLDVNDNAPEFPQKIYYAGINKKAVLNELIATLNATDKDLGANSTIEMIIAASYLFKFGHSQATIGSIVPSPFAISNDGRLTSNSFMAEYNQDRFELEIHAKEVQSPERVAKTKVYLWVFEPEQLIRIILSRPPSEVREERDEIVFELTNVTKKLIIIDEIRYHVDGVGRIRMDWCDLYFHAVDTQTNQIVPVSDILNEIDSKYDFLKDYYTGFAIENVVPAFTTNLQEEFDVALAGIIALVIVLFVGAISFIVLCCCLKNWVISIPAATQKDALIKKQIIDDLNTTENPLWIEQKLKLYEEQELTMQVFSDPNEIQMPNDNGMSSVAVRHQNLITQNLIGLETPPSLLLDGLYELDQMNDGGIGILETDNTYATIQPRTYNNNDNRSNNNLINGSNTNSNSINLIDTDYATLRSSNAPPPIFEFNGSTFQVQQNDPSSDYITELM